MRWVVVLLIFTTVSAHASKVYVCKSSDGGTLFAQTPCPAGYSSEQRTIDAPSSSGGASETELRKMADNLAQSNAKIRLERDLKNAQRKLKKLQDARQSNIRSQSDSAQSIAGLNSRNRSQAIIENLRAQTEKYDEDIRQQRQKIIGIEKRLAELKESRAQQQDNNTYEQAM